MSRSILIYLAWIAIIASAVYLRTIDIGYRPMHFDEATGARIAANHLESGHYKYDPTHFHGPTLSFFTKQFSRFSGQDSWKNLRAESLRAVTVVAGILTVFVPMIWIRWMGMGQAIASAALLATSPLLVYYSRMYIHETLLGLFGILTLTLSALAWIEQKRIHWVLAGISLGFMAATKATFVVSLTVWSLAVAVTLFILKNHFNLKSVSHHKWKLPVCWMLPVAAATAVLLYTDGFKNPMAVVDFAKTFFIYETVQGHDKPFFYYLSSLLLPRGNLRLFWWEGGIAILALMTIVFAYQNRDTNRHPEQRFIVPFLALSAILHFIFYGLIAYKTPWIILFTWIQAILLGGMLLKEIEFCSRKLQLSVKVLLASVIAIQAWQAFAVVNRSTGDQRIPYSYVPTSGDVTRLPVWLEDLQAIAPNQTLEPIAVLGTFYWPLPWYLRGFDQIGYWKKMDPALSGFAVIFVMPDQFEPAAEKLSDTHVALPRGLRLENPMMLYIRKDIWDAWMKEDS